ARVPAGLRAEWSDDDAEWEALGDSDAGGARREQAPHAPQWRVVGCPARREDDEGEGHPADRDGLGRQVEPAEEDVSERGHDAGSTTPRAGIPAPRPPSPPGTTTPSRKPITGSPRR